ncbi:hypothetical protein ACOSQ2_030082 [Xanthoceras sorbifolium]
MLASSSNDVAQSRAINLWIMCFHIAFGLLFLTLPASPNCSELRVQVKLENGRYWNLEGKGMDQTMIEWRRTKISK